MRVVPFLGLPKIDWHLLFMLEKHLFYGVENWPFCGESAQVLPMKQKEQSYCNMKYTLMHNS